MPASSPDPAGPLLAQLLAASQLPGCALTPHLEPCCARLSPIAAGTSGAHGPGGGLVTTVLPNGRAFAHPPWVRVSEASRYSASAGQSGRHERGARRASLGLSALGSVAAALPALPIPLPVPGRAAGRLEAASEAEAAEAAEHFSVEAAVAAADLDLRAAPLSPLFVREALRLLPDAAGEPGALDRAKRCASRARVPRRRAAVWESAAGEGALMSGEDHHPPSPTHMRSPMP